LRLPGDWCRHLVGGGHEVIHVLAVDDAWHVIENYDFDVVVTDILLRDEDGQIIGKKRVIPLPGQIDIRLRPEKRPKCIAISGMRTNIDIPYGPMPIIQNFGVDAALGKPITPLEFSAEVAKLSDLQQIAIILNQAAGLRVRAAGERKRNLPQHYGKLL